MNVYPNMILIINKIIIIFLYDISSFFYLVPLLQM